MNEWMMIALMAVSGTLFAAGGTDIPGVGGQKWMRRYLLPIVLFSALVLSCHVLWWVAILGGFGLIVALSLGYGERTRYPLKLVVFSCYGLPSLLIGFSWWVVITPVVLFAAFVASNWKPLATTVFWKSWEFLAGALIAYCFIGAVLNPWSR